MNVWSNPPARSYSRNACILHVPRAAPFRTYNRVSGVPLYECLTRT